MWYTIAISTFASLLWLFTQVGPGGQKNWIAQNFFRGKGWFNAWRWIIVYVIITVIVAVVSTFTNIHIMPEPSQPYHMPAGFYWWSYTVGLFIFILIWRVRKGSYLQKGGPFLSNFRRFFITYAIFSLICISLIVVSLKAIGIAILGARWGSEQIEEQFDQQVEKVKKNSTFKFR